VFTQPKTLSEYHERAFNVAVHHVKVRAREKATSKGLHFVIDVSNIDDVVIPGTFGVRTDC